MSENTTLIFMTPDDFLRAITPGMQQPDGKLHIFFFADGESYLLEVFIVCTGINFVLTSKEIAHVVLVSCKYEVFDASSQRSMLCASLTETTVPITGFFIIFIQK